MAIHKAARTDAIQELAKLLGLLATDSGNGEMIIWQAPDRLTGEYPFCLDVPLPSASLHTHLAFVGHLAEMLALTDLDLLVCWNGHEAEVDFRSTTRSAAACAPDLSWAAMRSARSVIQSKLLEME